MDFLIEMSEFAACIAEEELALDPYGEAEDIGEQQSAVQCDAMEVVVQDEVAPRHKEVQLVHGPEAEHKENKSGYKDGVGDHLYLSAAMKERHVQKKSGEVSASPQEG
jgi:hypothetical protein